MANREDCLNSINNDRYSDDYGKSSDVRVVLSAITRQFLRP